MRPFVSVLMPAYNCEKYIASSVESVVRQSYPNWELVVVNDGSTDDTLRVLEAFGDSRIRIVNNPRNMGIAGSRNNAVRNAQGEYVAWLDSDDLASDDRLERQVEYLESHPDDCLCCGKWEVIDSNGTVIEKPARTRASEPLAWSLLWRNPIAQSSVTIRRSAYERYGLGYSMGHAPAEDYDLWCRIALIGGMHMLDDIVLKYRVLENSAYHSNRRKAMESSMESNERFVRGLTGECPSFHRTCTAFGWVVPDRAAEWDARALLEWYDRVKRAYVERFHPAIREVAAIDASIRGLIAGNLRDKPELLDKPSAKSVIAKYSIPLLVTSLLVRPERRARELARCIIRRSAK